MPPFPSFAEFFRALWGKEPFPWQQQLADRVAAGCWPRALDLPTATGKTACIDIAIHAMAAQADRPVTERTAPRRLWFVVDRRIVVDEAFARASHIARKLQEADDGPLRAVAARLLDLSGLDPARARPLAVARLRGGTLRDDSWARLPSQPAVITSTVDQLGSRLLFRGYGPSLRTASIYAGLAANDSLILLDEAHCSVPFMQTLRAVERFRGPQWADAPLPLPFACTILSATPPADIAPADRFPGAGRAAALDDPELRRRLDAAKPAELVLIKPGKDGADPLPAAALARARACLTAGSRRVAVMVNRVNTAWDVAALLRRELGDAADVVTFTGRLRPLDRDQLTARWSPVLRAADPDEPARPVVVVATQCLEVGADFSFDALVSEAASLDALRQRFGRLNRLGRVAGPTPAAILIREGQAKPDHDDPVYGTALSACWALLTAHATCETVGKVERRSIDFGITALDALLAEAAAEDIAACLAPAPDAPVLLPAHLDLLCQTSPAPAVEPHLPFYLHGVGRDDPQVQVLWREDLPETTAEWAEIIALCPPASGEMVSVPLWRLHAWMRESKADEGAESDVVGGAASDNHGKGPSRFPLLVWRGRDATRRDDRPAKIRRDDIVVLRPNSKIPPDALVQVEGALDLWEQAQAAAGRRPALRLNRGVLKRWLHCPPLEALLAVAEAPDWSVETLADAVDAVLAWRPDPDDAESPDLPDWLRATLEAVRPRPGRRPSATGWEQEPHPAGGLVLFGPRPRAAAPEPELFADDDDLTSAADEAVSLARHSLSVRRAVEHLATRCLPPDYLAPLATGAMWHDVGKLDERFQVMLHQGDEVAAASATPLAKSAALATSPARRSAIAEAAGLPPGFRHEMLSLQLTERAAGLAADDADLVLHLVASHHGHARPFAPVVADPEPPPVRGSHAGAGLALEAEERRTLVPPHAVASGVADRFWRLTRRHGWWGLAYLEALLRLGDWYGSQIVLADEPPEQPAQPPAPPLPVRVAEAEMPLPGLDGTNPLGFLAALGTVVTLRRAAAPQARLAWRRVAGWQPVLTGLGGLDQDGLCAALADTLRGRTVPEAAEEARKIAQAAFDSARTDRKAAVDEIKRRGLRGKDRSEALDEVLPPLDAAIRQARDHWLQALQAAVPRPELALGKHIDCSGPEFRDYAAGFLADADGSTRDAVDFLAAFASDACLDRNGRVSGTPFCFVTGSGHQYFLDTVRQLMQVATPERLRAILFAPWTYSDEKLSLRWDPLEDRRYALMARDPTAPGNKSRTVWMANLLGYQAVSLFASAPGERGLLTTGWTRDEQLTWPLWSDPADPDTIRSLLHLADLAPARVPAGDEPAPLPWARLRARGIAAVFRAKRIKVGSGANFKVNFSPAQGA